MAWGCLSWVHAQVGDLLICNTLANLFSIQGTKAANEKVVLWQYAGRTKVRFAPK